jgi:magnesium transporter
LIKTYFYNHDEHTMYHDVDLQEKDELLASPNNLLWIDMYNCSASELHYIGDIFDFHPLALEDCLQFSPRAKIDDYEDYYFFVFHAMMYDENAEEEITNIELDVFLGNNYIVTIHPVALTSIGKIAQICLKNTKLMDNGAAYLLYSMVDNIVDEAFPIADRLGDRIDELEDNIFLNRGQEIVEEILTLKRNITLMRKVLIPQRNIFSNLRGKYSFFIKDDNIPYFLDLADHLNSLLDTTNTYRDFVNSSMESYYSIITGRTSEIITILTIISIIMMPLTVITGFYGMNVALPGDSNPNMVWIILASMIVLSIAMLVFFRYRKWI